MNPIKVRRGVAANLPTLEAGQIAFTTDTHKVYIGDGATNYELAVLLDVVAKTLFDAYTILMATTDNTPVALSVTEQTLIGRITGGAIAALSIAQIRTLLGITAAGVALIDDANAAAQIATLGLDADLATLALPANTTITAAGAAILDDANAAAQLATLGITATAAELNYTDGVSSAIQTQLDAKLPLAGGTMTGNVTLGENASVALDPAGSADEKWSGITVTGTAGATLAVGDLCYLASSWKWLLADADTAAAAGSVALGLCILAGNDTQATAMLLIGTMRSAAFPASITGGAQLYISQTAGDMTTTIPTGGDVVVRVCGWAILTEPNTVYFNPSSDFITRVS
jgi:hypothetical protein